MKRILGILAMLAAVVVAVFVACHHGEANDAVMTQLDELVTNAVIYRAAAEFIVDFQDVSWTTCPVYKRKLNMDWDERPYANIVAAPTFDPKFWAKKEAERKYVAAL